MKTAVITLAVGQAGQDMHDLSRPSQLAYAQRIGAEYAVIVDTTMAYPMGEKWRLSKLALPYDRIIFFDADVMVRAGAKNLFDLVPEGKVGLYDDARDMTPDKLDFWYHPEVNQIQREQELPEVVVPHCYNTGIVVFDRDHADIFAPPTKPFTPFFCTEQHLINIRLHARGYEVCELDRTAHWQWWSDREGIHKDAAQFVHFSGLRDYELRLNEMRAEAEKNNEPPAPNPVQPSPNAPQPKPMMKKKQRGCGCGQGVGPR